MTEQLDQQALEAAAKAYAESQQYYVPFHAGLDSESANAIRRGTNAALSAYFADLRARGMARDGAAYDGDVDGSSWTAYDETGIHHDEFPVLIIRKGKARPYVSSAGRA